jgi:flagellar hook-length control protein FliK
MLAQQGVDLGKVDVNVSQQQQGNSREQTKQTANGVNTPDLIESNEDESISTGYVTTKGIDFYA